MKQYTVEEKKKCVEGYKNSHLTISKYAKQNNISHVTLKRWLDKDNEGKFGEVSIAIDNPPTFNLVTDAIKIELKEGYSKNFLQGILEVILSNDN